VLLRKGDVQCTSLHGRERLQGREGLPGGDRRVRAKAEKGKFTKKKEKKKRGKRRKKKYFRRKVGVKG